jgi:predicted secreted protein
MKRQAFLIPLLAASSVAACSREPRPYEDTFTYTDTTAYTDTAETLRAAPGPEFKVVIRSNQSTGYQWVLVDSARLGPVRSAGSVYTVPPELRDRTGTDGAERWTFQALRPGEGTISLIHIRPWENTAPRDTTRFRVIVE